MICSLFRRVGVEFDVEDVAEEELASKSLRTRKAEH